MPTPCRPRDCRLYIVARVHKGGSSLFSLTPNPCCGDVESQPPGGREIVVYTLCGSSTQRGQFTFLLTPNPRCGDVECQPPAGREIVVYTFWLKYTKGAVHFSPNA